MSETLLQQYGLFLIGAGLSLALLLILFLLLRRNAQKQRGLRPAAAAIAIENELPSPHQEMPVASPDADDTGALPADDAGGFKLFKRKKSAGKSQKSKNNTENVTRLVDIEQEMLAIRELFRTGQISRSVYVAETKALYETARLVQK